MSLGKLDASPGQPRKEQALKPADLVELGEAEAPEAAKASDGLLDLNNFRRRAVARLLLFRRRVHHLLAQRRCRLLNLDGVDHVLSLPSRVTASHLEID